MSLRKMSEIMPDVMAEIARLIDARHEEKRERERASAREGVQARKAGIEGDLQAENQPADPRMRAGRARRGRGGRQLELELQQTIRRN